MAGSPLKRTSTAMDEEKGLLYFKKRKLSAATPLSQVSTPTDENGGRNLSAGRSVTRTPEVVERVSISTFSTAKLELTSISEFCPNDTT